MNYESFNRSLFRLKLYNKVWEERLTTRTAGIQIGISAPTTVTPDE